MPAFCCLRGNDTLRTRVRRHQWEPRTLSPQSGARRQLCSPAPRPLIAIYQSEYTHTRAHTHFHIPQTHTECLLSTQSRARRVFSHPVEGLARCLGAKCPGDKLRKHAFCLEIWPYNTGTPLLRVHLTALRQSLVTERRDATLPLLYLLQYASDKHSKSRLN